MSNKSRVSAGSIILPGHPLVMINENSNNITSVYNQGLVVTQNNSTSNPVPTQNYNYTGSTLSLLGVGS